MINHIFYENKRLLIMNDLKARNVIKLYIARNIRSIQHFSIVPVAMWPMFKRLYIHYCTENKHKYIGDKPMNLSLNMLISTWAVISSVFNELSFGKWSCSLILPRYFVLCLKCAYHTPKKSTHLWEAMSHIKGNQSTRENCCICVKWKQIARQTMLDRVLASKSTSIKNWFLRSYVLREL